MKTSNHYCVKAFCALVVYAISLVMGIWHIYPAGFAVTRLALYLVRVASTYMHRKLKFADPARRVPSLLPPGLTGRVYLTRWCTYFYMPSIIPPVFAALLEWNSRIGVPFDVWVLVITACTLCPICNMYRIVMYSITEHRACGVCMLSS